MLNASKADGGGEPITIVEAGTYPARLVIIASLGLQKQSYKGEDKDPRVQIQTIYELLDEFMKDENGNELPDKPLWMWDDFAFFNLSSDRAVSTKRYMALDPEMKFGGEWSELIGTPCMLTLSVNEGKGKNKGRFYNNISNVSTMRAKEADKAPELVNKPLVFDTDEPDMEVFKALPDAIQNKIKNALDFEGSPLDQALGGDVNPKENSSDNEDEVPW